MTNINKFKHLTARFSGKVLDKVLIVIIILAAGFLLLRQFGPKKFDYPKGDAPEEFLTTKDDSKETTQKENQAEEEANKAIKAQATSHTASEILVTNGVKHLISLDEIYDGGPGKDGIPSIDSPKFVSVDEALKTFQKSGFGLSVELNGEARFYPYQILVWHELINDKFGDFPVLVSFCPLCGSGLVFDRRVNGQEVEFGVSGKLHNSDLLMYDRKTDTLWAQILGKAVVGPLTGMQLKQLPASVVDFETFSQKFKNGKVLSKNTGFNRNYDTGPYGNYDTNDSIYFPIKNSDSRLHSKTRVLGIEIDGQFKAYTLEDIEEKGVIQDTFNNHQLEIKYNGGFVEIKDKTTNQSLVPVNTFWFGWFAFHPDTEVY